MVAKHEGIDLKASPKNSDWFFVTYRNELLMKNSAADNQAW
jgi:hypothetical protein